MPPVPKFQRLLEKGEAALIAAISAYNKPDAPYREETFAILMLNAWELLLKAKLVQESNNDVRCLYVYERRKTKAGTPSKRPCLKRNRTGQPFTKELTGILTDLDAIARARVPVQAKENLEALTQIRDNAIHYFNATPRLAKLVLEVGTASVRNFLALARRWFKRDLSRFSLYLMPVGFISAPADVSAFAVSPDEKNLVAYLASLVKSAEKDPADEFHVAVGVELKFQRAKPDALAAIAVTKDPTATKVYLTEEDFRERYPLTFQELLNRCKQRYSDFSPNAKFHAIRNPLKTDPAYSHTRSLEPSNPKAQKKIFHNTNIFQILDEHYTRRK